MAAVRRAAVLGKPISHSLSPLLHRAAYAQLGLTDWAYDAHEVDEAGLPVFVEALTDDWAGLSLTMPLKRAVLPLLDEVSAVVTETGAANTLLLRDGRRLGDNTDVPGIVNALRERGASHAHRAVVLGGGATAASAICALARLGADRISLVTRRPESARELAPVAERTGVRLVPVAWEASAVAELLGTTDVVVGAATAGAADGVAALLPAHVEGVLLDVVYDPWPTALASAWERAGGRTASGLDLLVHQATLQVLAMTGVGERGVLAAELVEPMRTAGLAALAARL